MEFKFNFGGFNGTSDINNINDEGSSQKMRECIQHELDPVKNEAIDIHEYKNVTLGCNTLYYLNPETASQMVKSFTNFSFLQSSDLESGEYEGGLKVWECTYDLLHYLRRKFNGKKDNVLDLGCGCGLLGLYCFLCGSKNVCLQDYNSEVIEHFTIPSVQQTLHHHKRAISDENKFELFSGDWTSVDDYLKEVNHSKFDLMLSSETIYNVSYYYKLKDILVNHLSDTGVALFAAKKHYFGVGGSIMNFTEYLEKDGEFHIHVVDTIEDNLIREILEVRKNLK